MILTSLCTMDTLMYHTFAMFFVAALTCVLICTHLARLLQSACAELEIYVERPNFTIKLTRTKTEVAGGNEDMDEIKSRLSRLEDLMARVLKAVDKPLSPNSATSLMQIKQKTGDIPQDTSDRAQPWMLNVPQAREAQSQLNKPQRGGRVWSFSDHAGGTPQDEDQGYRDSREARDVVGGRPGAGAHGGGGDGSELGPVHASVDASFFRSYGKLSSDCNLSTQPVQNIPNSAMQVCTLLDIDTSPNNFTVDDALRMLNRRSDAVASCRSTDVSLSDMEGESRIQYICV